MKRSYEKPMLNASMNGTLEGVYAYGTFAGISPATKGCGNEQPPEGGSKNQGCGKQRHGHWENVTVDVYLFGIIYLYSYEKSVWVWD